MLERLTKEYQGEETIYGHDYVKADNVDSFGWEDECVDKLGRIEDIEEWLEIDIFTLFNAMENGIYTDKYSRKKRVYFDAEEKALRYLDIASGDVYEDEYYYLCDYGKTWALTKEELENDN